MIHKKRIEGLQKEVAKAGLDAFVITFIPDLTYLTDIAMEGYWMAVSRDNWWVITNRLLDVAFRDMGVKDVNMAVKMDFKGELKGLIEKNDWKQLGFDGEGASYGLGKYFESLGAVSKPQFLGPLRITKDKEEISKIRKACQITARSIDFVAPKLKPGVTEGEINFLIEQFMRKNGASRTSFDLIIGSGPNSAIPHYRTANRKMKEGDAVVIDIGCVYDNYCSDMTRTLHVGKKKSALFQKIHGIVAQSQMAGIKKVRAGLRGRDVDSVCRQIIEKEGYGKEFTHGTGHGVGIQIHEPPWVRASSDNVLGAGMIITVEPGIYLDGKLGVRIEDTVAVTDKGCEVLTKSN